jgi:hypothetical protein
MSEKFNDATTRLSNVSTSSYYPSYKEALESLMLDLFGRYDLLDKESKKQKRMLKKELDEKIELARNITAVKNKLQELELKEKMEKMSETTADEMLKIIEEIERNEELNMLGVKPTIRGE